MNNNSLPTHCRGRLPKAVFRHSFSDFQVTEQLGFEPDGEGAHLWIQVKKEGCNTQDVLTSIAKALSVPERDVGYSGLKDKQAITWQWFSVPYPVNSELPDITQMNLMPGAEVTRLSKSNKKLRRGVHKANEFKITLRQIDADQEGINQSLELLKVTGFPNYFGPQRFGIDGRNVDNARSMFTRRRKLSRFKRSVYLSAARSMLFNQVLALRVQQENWLTVLPGEVCMLDGTRSVFQCEQVDLQTQQRHDTHDIHNTGPMFGAGDSMATLSVLELETQCLQQEELLCTGLIEAGLKAERRALRAKAGDLQWQWLDQNTLQLAFSLARSAYATSLLREVVELCSKESIH